MAAMPSRHRLRPLSVALGLGLVVVCLYVASTEPLAWTPMPSSSSSTPPSPRSHSSLSLTDQQCRATFPGLLQSVDDIVAEGPFRLNNTGDMGALQGRIKNGQIYIINAQRRADLSEEMLNSRTAALHQLHRAIVTAREPVPDTVFSLNFQDQPFGTSWGYSRAVHHSLRSKDPDARSFLMPHFAFWAWDLPYVGSIGRAAAAIAALERDAFPRFVDKIPRAVWRGTTWFNSVHNPRLRQNLIAATRGKAWADVAALDRSAGTESAATTTTPSNALAIEDFCRYRYTLHTEGIAYSGRFHFLQMCNSVTLTPPLLWMQHTTHLVKPVFSSALLAGRAAAATRRPSGNKYWPVSYAPGEANIVFVASDWSDLESTIAWLEAHPAVSERVARRQRDLFVGGGYFSPAAEACYWRALVRGWSQVATVDERDWRDQGTPFEAFVLSNGH